MTCADCYHHSFIFKISDFFFLSTSQKWNVDVELKHLNNDGKRNCDVIFQFLPYVNKVSIHTFTIFSLKNFKISGDYSNRKKKLYSVDFQSKIQVWNSAKCSLEAISPTRKFEAETYLRLDNSDRFIGNARVNWDAGKKKKESSEISLETSYKHTQDKKNSLFVKGLLQLKTPFKKIETMTLSLNLDKNENRLSSNGRVSMGGKQNAISLNLETMLPMSPSRVKFSVTAKSPIRGYRQIQIEVDHKLGNSLSTTLRSKMNKAENQLTLKGNAAITNKKRDITGEVYLKTPLRNYREIKLNIEHRDDYYKKFITNATFNHNNELYKADLIINNDYDGKDLHNGGELTLSFPKERVITKWDHQTKRAMKRITSRIESSDSKNKKIFSVDTLVVKNNLNSMQLDIDVTTKSRDYKKISLQMSHDLKNNKENFANKIVFTKNKIKTGYELHFDNSRENKEASFDLYLNPFYSEDVSLRSSHQAKVFPMTILTEFEWAQNKKIMFDGSLNAPSYNDFDLSSKVTTPFKNYEDVLVKMLSKKERSELTVYLNIEYDIKKAIEIESRFRNDESKKHMKVSVKTPLSIMKSLKYGIQLDSHEDVEFRVDFDLQSKDRYESHVIFQKLKNDDVQGKFQLISPIEGLSNIEMNAWMNKRMNSQRVMHLDFKPNLESTYSLDSSCKTESPIEFKVSVNTPYSDFKNVGFEISHDLTDDKIISKAMLTYLSKQSIEASLNINLRPNIDAVLSIQTPLERFENNKVTVFQDIEDINDFKSKVSIVFGKKNVAYDLQFKNKNYKTNGALSLVTPVEGFEIIKGSFMVKGKLQNLKSEIKLQIGDEQLNGEFSNMMKSDSLKSEIKVTRGNEMNTYKDKLHISFNQEDRTTQESRIIKSRHFIEFDERRLNLNADVNFVDYENVHGAVVISLPSDDKLSLSLKREQHNIEFTGRITTIKDLMEKEFMRLDIHSKGQAENFNSLFNLTLNDRIESEIVIKTYKDGKSIIRRLTTRGDSMHKIESEMKISNHNSKFTVNSGMEGEEPLTHTLDIRSDSNVVMWELALSRVPWHRLDIYKSWKLSFKRDLTKDMKLTFKSLVFNDRNHPHGIEIEHDGNFKEFKTTLTSHFGQKENIVLTFDFLGKDIEYIKLDTRLTFTPKDRDLSALLQFGFKDGNLKLKLKLAHISKRDIRLADVTLLIADKPHYHYKFSVLSSDKKGDYKNLVLSAQLDQDGIMQSEVIVDDEQKFSLSGDFSNKFSPFFLTYRLNEYKVNAHGSINYENMFKMRSSLSIDFDNHKIILAEIDNTQDSISKKSSLTVGLGPEWKVSGN